MNPAATSPTSTRPADAPAKGTWRSALRDHAVATSDLLTSIRRAPPARSAPDDRWTRSRGRFTHGTPTVRGWDAGPHAADIGAFCSIATGVVIQTGGNHRTDWATTFPVRERLRLPRAGHDGHPPSDGDVAVGHDVCLGEGAMVLSGVTIGTGAVVEPRSVVTQDVPPYTVVGGIPARTLRARFDDDTAAALLASRWWEWPRAIIEAEVDLLCAPPGPSLLALAEDVTGVLQGRSDGRPFHTGVDLLGSPAYEVTTSPGLTWGRVAVVVACYDHARYVAEALHSVCRQTFGDVTVVVTDDCSNDDTAAVAADVLARSGAASWLVARRRENAGLPTILNDVLHTVDSPLLAFLGGDDLWEPTKLRRQVEALEQSPGAAAVITDAWRIGTSHGRQFARWGYVPTDRLAIEDLVERYPVTACTPLYSAAHLRLVGGWDRSLSYEDQGMMLELADTMEIRVIDEPLASHRYHASTSSQLHARAHLLSRHRLLTGWLGRTPTMDASIDRAVAGIAERLYDLDVDAALPVLEELDDRSPDRRTRALLELARRGIGPETRRARAARRLVRPST